MLRHRFREHTIHDHGSIRALSPSRGEWIIKKYKIALIPGDGIGNEVVPEGVKVLVAAGHRFGISFEWDERPWGCEYYLRTGRMMPQDGLDGIRPP